jgi:hypothetical protein
MRRSGSYFGRERFFAVNETAPPIAAVLGPVGYGPGLAAPLLYAQWPAPIAPCSRDLA